MAFQSDYTTGTISITNGTTALVGVGTAWLSANLQPGDTFLRNNLVAVIASVNSNTSITLASNWTGGTLAAATYRIRFQSDLSRVAAQTRALINLLGAGNVSALAALDGTGGSKMIELTGVGSMVTLAMSAAMRAALAGQVTITVTDLNGISDTGFYDIVNAASGGGPAGITNAVVLHIKRTAARQVQLLVENGGGAGAAYFRSMGTGGTWQAWKAIPSLDGGNNWTSVQQFGVYSATGATDGKQITGQGVLLSSRSPGGTTNHQTFANPNGVVGAIRTSGSATSYDTSSDQNLKENFRSFNSGELIDGIANYQFDWKAGGAGYGVKAQECYEVFPDAISVGTGVPGDEDYEPWGADYSKFVPLLLAEVKALRARVAALESPAP